MRIVGGEWKGRPIEAPEGRDVTRPTTDRVREAVSSRALDAFAGSGALGLEMLSRGASWCTFVDLDRDACARVRRNAASLGADPMRYNVVRGDSARLAAGGRIAGAPFDIVLLDPPYATEATDVAAFVESLDSTGLLTEDAIILYERGSNRPTIEPAGFVPLKQKRYGHTSVDLLGRDK